MSQTIGTCGLCGGRVALPTEWLGINPPVPRCESCGARKKHPWGPVVEMEPHPSPFEGMTTEQMMEQFKRWKEGFK